MWTGSKSGTWANTGRRRKAWTRRSAIAIGRCGRTPRRRNRRRSPEERGGGHGRRWGEGLFRGGQGVPGGPGRSAASEGGGAGDRGGPGGHLPAADARAVDRAHGGRERPDVGADGDGGLEGEARALHVVPERGEFPVVV